MSLARRACALVAVLALLAGGIVPAASTGPGCAVCPPGCPMHARRIGCHEARSGSCHRGAPAAGVRSSCGHRNEAAPSGAATIRAVVLTVVVAPPPLAARAALLPTPPMAGRPLPEPPTGPPRSPVA